MFHKHVCSRKKQKKSVLYVQLLCYNPQVLKNERTEDMTRTAQKGMERKWGLLILSLAILLMTFVMWLSMPSIFTSEFSVGSRWFNLYLILGTWAIIHLVYNAIVHGLGYLPTFIDVSPERRNKMSKGEHLFSWFSIFTLFIIPFISIPVMMSLHLELSSAQSLVDVLHSTSLLTIF